MRPRSFLATDAHWRAWSEAAERAGEGLSDWIRDRLNEAAKRQK